MTQKTDMKVTCFDSRVFWRELQPSKQEQDVAGHPRALGSRPASPLPYAAAHYCVPAHSPPSMTSPPTQDTFEAVQLSWQAGSQDASP